MRECAEGVEMDIERLKRTKEMLERGLDTNNNLREAIISVCKSIIDEDKVSRIPVVTERLFSFESFEDWQDLAVTRFDQFNVSAQNTICVDSAGRLCFFGEHFRIAEEQKTYPITVYKRA